MDCGRRVGGMISARSTMSLSSPASSTGSTGAASRAREELEPAHKEAPTWAGVGGSAQCAQRGVGGRGGGRYVRVRLGSSGTFSKGGCRGTATAAASLWSGLGTHYLTSNNAGGSEQAAGRARGAGAQLWGGGEGKWYALACGVWPASQHAATCGQARGCKARHQGTGRPQKKLKLE